MTAKIVKSSFKKEYSGAHGITYYHDVTTEGETKPWNIGSKEKNPDFLAVGAILNFEIEDESKRKIKKVKVDEFTAPPVKDIKEVDIYEDISTSLEVVRAISNATLLIAHGISPLADLKKIAHRMFVVGQELKEEFK